MTTKRNIETIQRRIDWLKSRATNQSALQELAALKWAVYKLTTQEVESKEIENARSQDLYSTTGR